jgi:hypothetical protein
MNSTLPTAFLVAAMVAGTLIPQDSGLVRDDIAWKGKRLADPEPDYAKFPVFQEASSPPKVVEQEAFAHSVERLTGKAELHLSHYIASTRRPKDVLHLVEIFDECGDSPHEGFLRMSAQCPEAVAKLRDDRDFCQANGSLTLAGTAALITAHCAFSTARHYKRGKPVADGQVYRFSTAQSLIASAFQERTRKIKAAA